MRNARIPNTACRWGRLAPVFLVAFVIAACGTSDGDEPATNDGDRTNSTESGRSVPPTNSESVPTSPPAGAASPEEVVVGSDPLSADGTPNTDVGEMAAEVDAAELVIVDLTDSVFDLALFGIPAAANFYGSDLVAASLPLVDGVDSDVAELVVAADDVTSASALNLEVIAALEPDLILSSPTFLSFYDVSVADLESIAPVRELDVDVPWRERVRSLAQFVEADDVAEQRIDAVERQIENIAQRVQDAGLGGTPVSVLRPFQDQVAFFHAQSLAGEILAAVGLTQPEAQLPAQAADSIFPVYAAQTFISPELLPDHDADVVVVPALDPSLPPDEAFADGIPVNEVLSAFPNGDAFTVPYFLWALNSLAGVEQIVEDVDRIVAQLESQ